MREFLYLLAVPITPLLGLAAFTAWWSAALFLAGIAVVGVIAVRYHEKHHRAEAFDDKLSAERMEEAREWLLEK